MTNRHCSTGIVAGTRVPLSVLLYGVLEDAKKYEDCLEPMEVIHDEELADFLRELRDDTRKWAKRTEYLLAQRLSNGGVQ